MSITAVLNNAISGLNASQAALQVTSTNIANVNTPGYARSQVFQQTRVLGGVGSGVEIAEVRRIVDKFVAKELRVATAHSGQFDAMSRIHDQIQSLLGDPAANTSLPGKLNSVFETFGSLPLSPDSVPLRTGLVADITALGDEFNRLATSMQQLRAEADRQAGLDIDKVNKALERILDLNQQIQREQISNRSAPGLEEQRDRAIEEIASIIDIRTFDMADGALGISTTSGVALLDNSLRKLVYTPSGAASANSVFSQITVNRVDTTTGIVSSVGHALDAEISSGSLRGWLDMRDRELPNLALEIGEMASQVADEINRIHNDNVAVPPAASLTGRNTGLLGGDPHNFTGQATFFAFDANNDITNQVTIDFGVTGPTINDVIAAVNAGLGGDGTMAITNGVLSLTAGGAATGIGIQQDAASPSDRGGRGFSHFFGMNDLIEAKSEAHFDTGVAAGNAHNFTGIINLQLRGPNNDVPVDVNIDLGALGGTFGTIETALDTQFAGFADFSFGANGELIVTPAAGFEDYKIHIASDGTNRGGTGVNFGQMFGLGDSFRMDAAADFQVAPAIKANPQLISLAKVDAVGSPSVAASDGRGASLFQELELLEVSFSGAGSLPSLTMTLNDYAAQVLGDAGAKAAQAERLGSDRAALETELRERLSEVEGVNLDEELSNMVVFQTSYNAAARLIQTAREMFDVLNSL